MNEQSNQVPSFLAGEDNATQDSLWDYVRSMSPDTVSQLSKPLSPEVFQVMERNIVGMLGQLPPDQFNFQISTSRESLGQLLASAMMSGYFLRNAEQRLQFEKSIQSDATLPPME
ncbi:MAG: DUF760 domain-containing protein [Cyanothece sp. SIO2G6]|nr:DUF760 domain-containing protein [Cyanothece sp. SIO2G6]